MAHFRFNPHPGATLYTWMTLRLFLTEAAGTRLLDDEQRLQLQEIFYVHLHSVPDYMVRYGSTGEPELSVRSDGLLWASAERL